MGRYLYSSRHLCFNNNKKKDTYMLDLGKKEKEKKNERDDFISYLVRKKTEYLYKIP